MLYRLIKFELNICWSNITYLNVAQYNAQCILYCAKCDVHDIQSSILLGNICTASWEIMDKEYSCVGKKMVPSSIWTLSLFLFLYFQSDNFLFSCCATWLYLYSANELMPVAIHVCILTMHYRTGTRECYRGWDTFVFTESSKFVPNPTKSVFCARNFLLTLSTER